jgi:hypothetical protein
MPGLLWLKLPLAFDAAPYCQQRYGVLIGEHDFFGPSSGLDCFEGWMLQSHPTPRFRQHQSLDVKFYEGVWNMHLHPIRSRAFLYSIFYH